MENIQFLLKVAAGGEPADLVLTGARVVDLLAGQVVETSVALAGGLIAGVGDGYRGRETLDLKGAYLAPSYIDGHLHVESSLLCPSQLARAVAPHGTGGVVADPHEIANVMGLEGVWSMLEASGGLPVTFWFMAPSCVPASPLQDSGAELSARDLELLARHPRILGLAEMMNFPGAVGGDPEVLAKLRAFRGRPRDGHAPLLSGRALNAYALAGPDSDHECTRLEEAREKLSRGLWIMIREGGTAANLKDLLPLVNPHTERRCLLVSDDLHPSTLAGKGHLDATLRKAVSLGLDPLTALRLVTLNPARRFGLTRRGAVAPGWAADLVVLEDLERFRALMVFQAGRLVAEGGRCLAPEEVTFPALARNTMHPAPFGLDTFRVKTGGKKVRVIDLLPGQVLTGSALEPAPERDGWLVADPGRDLALAAVIERHKALGRTGLGLVRGFGFRPGLKPGALAGSVAHDSHNLLAVGSDPESLLAACREVAGMGGGLAVAREGRVTARLPLPLAGLMSDAPLEKVLWQLEELNRAAGEVCRLVEPFMPLSFIALEVIPHLKLTDRGLVDVDAFAPVELFAD